MKGSEVVETAAIIKKLREERGLSQEDLAKALGVTNQAVSTWETGKRLPRMGVIEKMSVLLSNRTFVRYNNTWYVGGNQQGMSARYR